MQLHLTNYRCFTNSSFLLPSGSFIITDNNGSGKTSILSAIYSLHTGKAFPSSKFVDYLQSGKDYFGIGTDDIGWFLSAKISATGRLVTKLSKPSSLNQNNVLTYQPSDNFWLYQSRSNKLGVLDQIIGQSNRDFLENNTKLIKFVKNKVALLRECRHKNYTDEIMIKYLGDQILEKSKVVWQHRMEFLINIQDRLNEFLDMIKSPVSGWKIHLEVSSIAGKRIWFKDIDKYRNINKFYEELQTGSFDHMSLWQIEALVDKVLFGAQRDDFCFISGNLRIEQVLSRGEMRLFVLWLKKNNTNPEQTIWLLDDIFNELDDEREQFLMSNIFKNCKQIVATGTRCGLINLEQRTVDSLRVEL